MSGQRREEILQLLSENPKAVTGAVLAQRFGVSRQVIVQDIALLRARGAEIIATAQGYIIPRQKQPGTISRRIACRHTPQETRAELLAMVESGCRVVDVTVEHPLYGEIRGVLLLESREDVAAFIARYESQDARLLLTLTGGVHLHTVESATPAALAAAEEKLRQMGVLLEEE